MTDLHTHILPGVDDGARTPQDSIAMLQEQFMQGVDTVVLTPHFYPDRESVESFLERRDAAFAELEDTISQLPQEAREALPQRLLGAEVAYVPGLHEADDLRGLCIGNTKHMLLELPFYPWDTRLIRGLYDVLGHSGVTPVLAHMERYFAYQGKRMLNEVLELGLPVQVGTDMLAMMFSPAMRLLRQGRGHLLASDCHDLYRRPPALRQAMSLVEKKLGQEAVEELNSLADHLAGVWQDCAADPEE